ncbi:hypothetical protein BDM02DRAFT_3271066, partial [Thelephora ganbajun]
MSWDPPTPLSTPPARMSGESRFPHRVGSASRAQTNNANIAHPHPYPPRDLSFLGPLPSSCDQAIQDLNPWNRSAQDCFPSQLLQGPGQVGPSPSSPPDRPPPPVSHKRKRTTSSDSAAEGGYGPIPDSLDQQTDGSTLDSSPAIKFTGRKSTAYEIWAFTRAVKTDEVVPAKQWLDDYNDHLTRRPDTLFVGCKFCTQFGNTNGTKAWKVFKNGPQTSPTSTLRCHFKNEHRNIWESESRRLNIPQKSQKRQVLSSNREPFTREGLVMRLQSFIVGDGQSIDVIENPHFRELLLYLGQGRVTDDDIPRTLPQTQK